MFFLRFSLSSCFCILGEESCAHQNGNETVSTLCRVESFSQNWVRAGFLWEHFDFGGLARREYGNTATLSLHPLEVNSNSGIFFFLSWALLLKQVYPCSRASHVPTSVRSFKADIGFHPIITSLKRWNSPPCNGLVKKSASIASVGQCWTDTSPALILSVMKKYLMLMCLDFCPHDIRPFFLSLIADSLSW